MKILELYFSDITDSKWDFLVEQSTGGLGNIAFNLIQKLEDFKKQKPEATPRELSEFIESLGMAQAGSGTQRGVFSIDDDHVIKIAWNDNGKQANKKEANPKVQGLLRNYIPKVYRADKGGDWVIMDKVLTAGDKGLFGYEAIDQWFQDIGFPASLDSSEINAALVMIYMYKRKMALGDAISKSINNYNWTEEQKRDFLESPIFSNLIRANNEFSDSFMRVIADLHAGNIGWTVDGKPVILDWG